MGTQKILKPGQFVVIEIKPGQNWPFTIGWVSDDYTAITCELLMEQPRSAEINTSEELLAVCATEAGVYRFPVRITEVEQEPVRLTLSLLKGATHVQRREFFRLPRPFVSGKYRPIIGPEDILSQDLIEAPIKDLSGNGIAFIIPMGEELAPNTPVRTEIGLPNRGVIGLVGQVVRCIPNDPIEGKCLLCINFVLIDEQDRDRIVGHLFKEQIDRAGKRRGLPRRF